jgi:hypothetical protein
LRRPLAVQDAILDRVVFPHQLAGVLVEAMIAGALGEGTFMAFVRGRWTCCLKMRSPQMTGKSWRDCGDTSRPPPSCRTPRSRRRPWPGQLRSSAPVVLAISKPLDVETPQHATVADVIELLALDERRTGDALNGQSLARPTELDASVAT